MALLVERAFGDGLFDVPLEKLLNSRCPEWLSEGDLGGSFLKFLRRNYSTRAVECDTAWEVCLRGSFEDPSEKLLKSHCRERLGEGGPSGQLFLKFLRSNYSIRTVERGAARGARVRCS